MDTGYNLYLDATNAMSNDVLGVQTSRMLRGESNGGRSTAGMNRSVHNGCGAQSLLSLLSQF